MNFDKLLTQLKIECTLSIQGFEEIHCDDFWDTTLFRIAGIYFKKSSGAFYAPAYDYYPEEIVYDTKSNLFRTRKKIVKWKQILDYQEFEEELIKQEYQRFYYE